MTTTPEPVDALAAMRAEMLRLASTAHDGAVATAANLAAVAPILRAIDAGLPVRVDAQPIPATDEVRALLEGRWTYTRRKWSGELHHRTPLMIRASDGTEPIHATHVCAGPAQPSLFEGLSA